MPGSVTSPAAGRSYPNEGTAVLLPQFAPYTDPVTVLICGGSNFGVALDNCVSIQPEVANATWVLERMVRLTSHLGFITASNGCVIFAAIKARDALHREYLLVTYETHRLTIFDRSVSCDGYNLHCGASLTFSTALPDGTYLILNGAMQGVAGFGLGSDPNFNAILYDPTQPVNERISILNNTIVARMYHSELTVSHRSYRTETT